MSLKADVKDLEAQYSFLRGECKKVSDDITKKSIELKKLEEAIPKIKSEYVEKLEDLKKREKALQANQKDFARVCNESASHLFRADEELREVKQQQKVAVKELNRLNEWILTAKESGTALDKKNEGLALEIDRRTKVIADIESLSYAKAQLESQVSKLKGDLSEIKDEIEQRVLLSQNATRIEEEKLRKAKLNREQEEILLTNTKTERLRIENDIAIYIGRAQIVYSKAFPELEMKL